MQADQSINCLQIFLCPEQTSSKTCQVSRKPPKNFKPEPYAYHEEVEVKIDTLTNLGHGLGRVDGWVIMVPFALPGEKVRVRIFRNKPNYSEADLVEVLHPSPHRVDPQCPLFTQCGGCQYQHYAYPQQLEWKRQQVMELLQRLAGVSPTVEPTYPSPKKYGYRSKLTPHYPRPRNNDNHLPIGFLRADARIVIDVPYCPIATEAINSALPQLREDVRARIPKLKRGGTLLLRDSREGVTTDMTAGISEQVGDLIFQFKAGEFFQNNPFILSEFIQYSLDQARDDGLNYLVDAYCGVGVFALSASPFFEQVAGVEVNAENVQWANVNARINRIENVNFLIGQAEAIFSRITYSSEKTSVLLDPPRKGCDEDFLVQLIYFRPRRIVYVSCAPDTQARDLKVLLDAGYIIRRVQPFDLFPQTRHIENIITLDISAS